jgi:drug/metabolite transporter (DMT)-like permease
MSDLHNSEKMRKAAVLAIVICVLIWGFSFISIKVAVAVFPPMTLGAVRFSMALVLLFTMYGISLKKAGGKFFDNVKEDFPLLVCSGLTGVTFYFFGENNGVALVTASEASIIVAAIPVLTVIADWLFSKFASDAKRKQLGWRHWLGAIVSMAGVVLVAGVSLSLSGSIKGYLYMGGAALCWVTYGLLTRPLFDRKRSRIYVVFWQNLVGFIGFLPFAFLERSAWIQPPPYVFLHVVFLGLCCSAMGYWLYAHALEGLGISVSAVFINLIPVVTVVAGFFILGDRLTLMQLAGAALVIGGVYLTVLPKRSRV